MRLAASRWRVAGVLAIGAAACSFGPSAGESTAPGQGTEPSSVRPPSALAGKVGQELALSVPLVGGGHQALAELRGRPVLLELTDASSPGRDAAQARYRGLVERTTADGSPIIVVSVALDAEVEALPASWTDAPPPFVLGWDPQGALAARLGLEALPTVVLIDANGIVVSVHEGRGPDDAAIEHWLQTPGSGANGSAVAV